MRRDEILALKEKRAHLHKEMIDLFAVAEGDRASSRPKRRSSTTRWRASSGR
jgi:hypothetical protein